MPDTRPRIWRCRIWKQDGPFEGIGFVFKAPPGFPALCAEDLVHLAEQGEIVRFQMGPVPVRVLRGWTREDRERLERFGPAMSRAFS